jgi:ribosomal protein L37E
MECIFCGGKTFRDGVYEICTSCGFIHKEHREEENKECLKKKHK